MKTPHALSILCLPILLAMSFLTGCSAAKRDEIWQIIDPAGYKHAHSESFNGTRALRSPQSTTPKDDSMALELSQ